MRAALSVSALVALSFAGIEFTHATEVAVCTDSGRIVIELNEAEAPLHTASFLQYVDDMHYSGTVFHRVIDGFMIQAGGFTRNLRPRITLSTVENESRNGLSNMRGTVAAARTSDPHSAAAQFFVNVVDNPRLDGNRANWGYTVFGHVTEGMDVVDAIAELPTGAAGPLASDVPDPLIAILSAARLDRTAIAQLDGPDRNAALLARIDEAGESDSPADALNWITHYRASCAPAEPELLVTEARHALAVEAYPRARFVLEEFFMTTPNSHRDYGEAEQLYTQIVADGRAGIVESSGCTIPSLPDIPDGASASLDEMLAGQELVREFMSVSDEYLECMDSIIDGEQTPPQARAGLVRLYNQFVRGMRDLGDEFNAQVRRFRRRQ